MRVTGQFDEDEEEEKQMSRHRVTLGRWALGISGHGRVRTCRHSLHLTTPRPLSRESCEVCRASHVYV